MPPDSMFPRNFEAIRAAIRYEIAMKSEATIREDSPSSAPRAWVGILIFAIASLTGTILFMHRLGSGGDNLDYLIYIRSMMEGEWGVIQAWRYPPGYPALAALALKISGIEIPTILSDVTNAPIYFLHALNIVFFALAAMTFWLAVEKSGSPAWIPLVAAVLWAVNQTSAASASQIASEPLFLIVSMLALGCWRSVVTRPSTGWSGLIVAALITTFGLLTRTAALSVVATAILFTIWNWRRIPRPRRTLAAAALPLFLYALYVPFTRQTAYMEILARGSFGEHEASQPVVERVLVNSLTYLQNGADLLLPKVMGAYGILDISGWSRLETAYWLLVLVVFFLGWAVYVVRQGVTIGLVYVGVTLGMILVQPYREVRYLIPILPFLFVYWLNGWHCLWSLATRRFGDHRILRRSGAALVTLVILWNVAVNGYAGVKNWRNIVALRNEPAWAPERYRLSREDDFADFIAACIWLGQNVPTNSVIYSRKPAFTYLASGRHAVPTLSIMTHHDLWREVSQQAAERPVYVIHDAFASASFYAITRKRVIDPFMDEYRAHLETVHESTLGTAVVKIRPPHPEEH